jgi:hypothetical protein
MNGMKKLLGVIGILALATAMLPAQGHADLRGSFAPLTSQSGFSQGTETATHRPDDGTGTMLVPVDGRLEPEWFSFTARSLVPGHENVRSIYLHWNQQQSGYFAVLLTDPQTGVFGHNDISYFDPAWSYDGRFLAYVRLEAGVQGLFVQEYFVADDFEAVYGPGAGADSPVGAPWLITNIGGPRHPSWNPSSYKLAFDSDLAGTRDIYTVDVDVSPAHIDGAPVRVTFDNAKAEQDPSWAPNGTDIAYTTNRFGPLQIEIVDASTSATHLLEANFAFVTHNNPDWDPTGGFMYYDAPGSENLNNVVSIWKYEIATATKCEIQFDNRADADPDVSPFLQHTRAPESLPYSYFLFTSQAANFGVNIWRGNPINSCAAPLPLALTISPTSVNYKSNNKQPLVIHYWFPPETKAAGFVCRNGNVGGEGVRNRVSILASPQLVNIPADPNATGIVGTSGQNSCFDVVDTLSTSPLVTERAQTCYFDRSDVVDRLVALGLTDKVVPLKYTAYSNLVGRAFQGFAYLKVTKSSGGNPASASLISTAPNPFNPVTRIKFAVAKPGTYSLRIYNVQGALVKTLASQRYDVGTHEAMWDGRTNAGGKAASGVYYAKISGDGGDASTLRLVMAK